ncbi:hypothetical protein SAMN05428950_103389 [Sphingomonas sp. OV641]|uniref:primase-helicase family protein n=1 Tax=Sphingomonas sp. OV641 TaxID=1881068 RepID=UPI0008CF248D|nr:primase-helicase family protein [Sphingomonas sp. OV641]SEJ83193.1 hypothetical protein SAMN05428950_103389 [Sphingomonas sp. OV641]
MSAMNREYAVLRDGKSVTVLVLEDAKKGIISDLPIHAFKTLEDNNNVFVRDAKGKLKLVNVAAAWLKWENRREYSGLGFYPGNGGLANHFNTFVGLPFHAKCGSWQLLQEHILVNLCEGDSGIYEHLLTWLAEIVQRPSKKTGSALVLLGEKGTGKSVFADAISKLLGRYAITVSQLRAIFGNFNAHLKSKLLVVAEEAAIAAAAGADGIIKDMITGSKIHIEGKGRETVEENNNLRLMFISNDDHVVRASIGTERRFSVLRCGDRNRGDHVFFDALITELENGGYEAMLHDLMTHVPANGWNSLRSPPKTAHLLAQQIETLTPIQEFMRMWLTDGFYEQDVGEPQLVLGTGASTAFKAIEIKSAIMEQLKSGPYGHAPKVSVETVARECERWLGATELRVNEAGGINTRRTLFIPKLSDARAHATANFGIKFGQEVDDLTGTLGEVHLLHSRVARGRPSQGLH